MNNVSQWSGIVYWNYIKCISFLMGSAKIKVGIKVSKKIMQV